MPPLPNPRHERFAQALFEGKTADEAYELAGYKANRGNASRMKANDSILKRLAELQSAVASKCEVTVESLLAELEQARARADGLDQLSAAVKAISEKTKISGLLVQKIEQKVEISDTFAEAESLEDLADKMLADVVRFRVVTEDDHAALVSLMRERGYELQDFMASIKARPIIGMPVVDNPAPRRHDEMQARKRQRKRELERQGIKPDWRMLTAPK
jgi:phage terminase small subunit